MPASEVMSLYRQHKLHSGPGGPVVKSKKQATAIQISMARKEGHHIPEVKGSYQQGGLVPETGNYKAHQGEVVTSTSPYGAEYTYDIHDPDYVAHPVMKHRTRAEYEGTAMPPPYRASAPPTRTAVETPAQVRTGVLKGSFQQGGAVQSTGDYLVHRGEEVSRRVPQPGYGSDPQNRSVMMVEPPPRRWASSPEETQARQDQASDIARRTRGAAEEGYQRALHTPRPPYEGGYDSRDPRYAIEGLQGHIAADQRRMGELATPGRAPTDWSKAYNFTPSYRNVRGSFDQGGEVKQTGNYEAHAGEELVPPERAAAPAATTKIENPAKFSLKIGGGGGGPNPWVGAMASNVNSPLRRVEGFKHGGTIPRTGIYRLHEGEHVIPANLAKHYREMKAHG